MADEASIPIIIGVGDYVNRSRKAQDGKEPLDLILSALAEAIEDSGSTRGDILQQLDSISAVRTWTWPYPDLPDLIGQRLEVKPRHTLYGEHGGNTPALLLDEAARRVSTGESKLGIVVGGEALASRKGEHAWLEHQI